MKPLETWAIEIKIVKGKSFPFSDVKEHQVIGLTGAKKGLFYRIADQAWTAGGFQQKKPFDALWIKAENAFVVPVFYIPRKKKRAYLIPIEDFLKLAKDSIKKSITEEALTVFCSFDL